MRIDSGEFTSTERVAACEWVEYSVGWDRREIRHMFTVEPEMPGSVKLTFERYLRDDDGKLRFVEREVDDQRVTEAVTEPFTIYASDRLGWLQRYLERTGMAIT